LQWTLKYQIATPIAATATNQPVCPQAVAFDTAHKLKLLDARIENIEMSGPQTK